jgi:Autographiviridae endonuclease VII
VLDIDQLPFDDAFVPGKTCAVCSEAKSETEFHRQGKNRARMNVCKECRREVRGPRTEAPERRRERGLWHLYKITVAQYTALEEAQDGLCAICGQAPDSGVRLSVDHCHATGAVRALLCTRCNFMVGVYENFGTQLAEYLAAYGDGNPLLTRSDTAA